ncbi:MAG TPA: hypothetical protein EYG51_16800 [Pseudomonadales bacterium]|nr:hypothetical protein [Pseudomonadales bacterium]
MSTDLNSNSVVAKGKLVTLKAGNYPIVGPGVNFLEMPSTATALLLECQGSRAAGESCWYALAKDQMIVVWEDQLEEDADQVHQ